VLPAPAGPGDPRYNYGVVDRIVKSPTAMTAADAAALAAQRQLLAAVFNAPDGVEDGTEAIVAIFRACSPDSLGLVRAGAWREHMLRRYGLPREVCDAVFAGVGDTEGVGEVDAEQVLAYWCFLRLLLTRD
jgi:hypothetical protein